jgi:hypothetical protein
VIGAQPDCIHSCWDTAIPRQNKNERGTVESPQFPHHGKPALAGHAKIDGRQIWAAVFSQADGFFPAGGGKSIPAAPLKCADEGRAKAFVVIDD